MNKKVKTIEIHLGYHKRGYTDTSCWMLLEVKLLDGKSLEVKLLTRTLLEVKSLEWNSGGKVLVQKLLADSLASNV